MTSESAEMQWERRLGELRAFQERYGHCYVPKYWPENRGLGKWVQRQRQGKRQGQLSEERSGRLEGIGFAWDGRDGSRPWRARQWESRFEELVAWKAEHGNLEVSRAENAALAEWVEHQRKRWRGHKLAKERMERLKGIGFGWEAEDPLWEQRLAQLRGFRDRFRTCNVEARQVHRWRCEGFLTEEEERELNALEVWVEAQRSSWRRGQLSAERVRLLEELGFKWKLRREWRQERWERMFNLLEAFHGQHGHFRVTEDPPGRPGLHRWVLHQRECWKKGKLQPWNGKRLKEIGFPLEQAEEPRWEQRYAELAAYKERHGHCNVPSHWAENKALGSWVMTQRRRKRLGRLREEQIKRLEGLGFEWGKMVEG